MALILVSDIVGCQQRPAGESPNPSTPSSEVFVSKEGNFQVTIRGKPTEQKQVSRGVASFTFTWGTDERFFAVAYSDHPNAATDNEKALQRLIDKYLEGPVEVLKAKFTEESRGMIANRYVGRKFRADSAVAPGGKIRGRVFFVGERLYRLMAIGTEEFVEGSDAEQFFNTFEVLK